MDSQRSGALPIEKTADSESQTKHTPGPWHVSPPTRQNPSRALVTALSGGVDIFVKGGGETAPTISLPPSIISTEDSRVSRVMAEASRIAVCNRELCDCGRSVTKVCPCGKEVCSAHWYDADGNHTISDKDGMCSECVSAVQEQTWGESRCGRTL
jgi:hypothetical protein